MGRLFFRERRDSHFFPEPPIPPYPGADVYGRAAIGARPDLALQVPTVWACVNLLANSVAMLPMHAYRMVPDGGIIRIDDPPLLQQPAARTTQSEWLHMLMVSLLLRGNAYGVITARDSRGVPTQIELQNPDQVSVRVDVKGNVSYWLSGKQVDNDDMWHVRGLTIPGDKIGLSPISYAAAVIGLDLNARRFASDFLASGGVPKGILSADTIVNQNQAQLIKERFMAASTRREVAVLGSGLKYQQIQIAPEESQFLQAQEATVSQIARYFGVPASMVGGNEGGSMTYANVEQRSLDFLTYAVSPWLRRIEDAMYKLLPGKQLVKFDVSALLRTDAETQAKVAVQLIAGRVKAPSEVRRELDLPPLTEEQKQEIGFVPLTIDSQGKIKELSTAAAQENGNV